MKFDKFAFGYVYCAPTGNGSSGGGVTNPYLKTKTTAPAPLQASKTDEHDNNAANLWRIVRKYNGQPETISKNELEGRAGGRASMHGICSVCHI